MSTAALNEKLASLLLHTDSQSKSVSYERLSKWIICLCVVNFDLEIGPSIDYTLPRMCFSPEDTTSM